MIFPRFAEEPVFYVSIVMKLAHALGIFKSAQIVSS